MSLQNRLTLVVQAIGADIKQLYLNDGDLTTLSTTDKTSLVNAINEIYTNFGSITEVDDTAPTSSTTKTYSASKLTDLLQDLKDSILGGASSAYDTLLEIQNLLGDDATAISGLITAVGNKVDYSVSQTLNSTQKLTASTNIGVGDPEVDLLAIYTTAKS
ncbi:MAG TPA: hypothetical protein VN698_14210 [Bacteroidia bacterium]|nr:hypothetical protein [Bacteroidia bacterium]